MAPRPTSFNASDPSESARMAARQIQKNSGFIECANPKPAQKLKPRHRELFDMRNAAPQFEKDIHSDKKGRNARTFPPFPDEGHLDAPGIDTRRLTARQTVSRPRRQPAFSNQLRVVRMGPEFCCAHCCGKRVGMTNDSRDERAEH